MNKLQFPRIDQASVNNQLQLLGYQDKQVYLRFFYPSDDPRKQNDKGRKSNYLNWQEIEKYQREGRGVYFVINGGGHKNEDVKTARAIFYEHDNLPKELQLNLWQTLNLPEPTFQVDTGGKSIHSYWVFEQPLSTEQWCPLQKDLLEFADADRSIKNPARVMRLAGAWHISMNELGNPVYNQSQIVSASGHKYNYEELRDIIPYFQVKREVSKTPQIDFTNSSTSAHSLENSNTTKQLPRHPDLLTLPVPAAVPLYACCRREVREWLDLGVPKGAGRNNAAIEVGLELIAVERYLSSLNQPITSSARQLFNEFCLRSEISEREEEERYSWCQQKNPTPSCTSAGVEACIKGWYWREFVKPVGGKRKFEGKLKNNTAPHHTPPAQSLNLSDRLREIVTSEASESSQHLALMDLAEAMGRHYRDIEKLAAIIRSEADLDKEVIEALAPLKQNLTNYHQRLDLNRYLHPTLAKSLIATAKAMPTAPEYLFTTLLSASASVIGTASKVIVNAEGGYTQPCIFWTGNVSHSGQMKTPVQKVIIDPLIKAEAEAYETYEEDKADYERDKNSEEAPPTRQRYLVNNVTIPVKIRLHAENKRGLLEYIDELVSDFNRLNQYTRGKGDDLQTELGLFNGSSVNYDRSDAKLFLARTGISKTGTYQWDTLARLMADETNFTASGYASRFLLCSIPDAPPRLLNLFNSYGAVENLQKLLTNLYGELEQLPERDYALSREAKTLFQAWNHNLVTAEMDESHFGMSLVYAKIESYTARIALWLHLINHLLSGQSIPPIISDNTMQAAIEIASFYLWQHRFIQAHNSPSRKLEGIYLKAQLQAEKLWTRAKKGVTASYLKARLNALKKWSVEKIRNTIFKGLVASGLGRIEGEGSNMIYVPFGEEGNSQTTTNTPYSPQPVGDIGDELVNPPTAESYSFQAVQTIVGGIGGNNSNLFDTEIGLNILSNFSYEEEEDIVSTQNLTDLRGVGFGKNQTLTPNTKLPLSTTNFTNSIPEPLIESGGTAIGDTHQHHHQPPIDNQEVNDSEKAVQPEIVEYDFNYLMEQIDKHLQRLGGTMEYWKQYLLEKYNVASRLYLTDEQIIEFWSDLRGFSRSEA